MGGQEHHPWPRLTKSASLGCRKRSQDTMADTFRPPQDENIMLCPTAPTRRMISWESTALSSPVPLQRQASGTSACSNARPYELRRSQSYRTTKSPASLVSGGASRRSAGCGSDERGPTQRCPPVNARRERKKSAARSASRESDGPAKPEKLMYVFVDNTNTFSQVPRRTPEQMAKRLSVGEQCPGRHPCYRIVVGSARSEEARRTWLHRYDELRYPEVYMDVLGDGAGRGGKEAIVDDALHANMALTVLQAELDDVTAEAEAPPRVMVLYSGDSNENHGRVSFPQCVELALQCGWAVEVVHKMPSLTPQTYLRTQGEPWGEALKTVDLRASEDQPPSLASFRSKTSSLSSYCYSGSFDSDDGCPRQPPATAVGSCSSSSVLGVGAWDEPVLGGGSSSSYYSYHCTEGGGSSSPSSSCGSEDGAGLACVVADKLIADVARMRGVWQRLQLASEAAGESVDDIRGRVECILDRLTALVAAVQQERAAPTPREAFVVSEPMVARTTAYLSRCPGCRVLRNELRRQLRKSILPEVGAKYENGCVDLVTQKLEERRLAYLHGVGAKTEVVLFRQHWPTTTPTSASVAAAGEGGGRGRQLGPGRREAEGGGVSLARRPSTLRSICE